MSRYASHDVSVGFGLKVAVSMSITGMDLTGYQAQIVITPGAGQEWKIRTDDASPAIVLAGSGADWTLTGTILSDTNNYGDIKPGIYRYSIDFEDAAGENEFRVQGDYTILRAEGSVPYTGAVGPLTLNITTADGIDLVITFPGGTYDYLTKVADDPAPTLGGTLTVPNEHRINLLDELAQLHAMLLFSTAIKESGMWYSSDGVLHISNAGLSVGQDGLVAYGPAMKIAALEDPSKAPLLRTVKVTAAGLLVAVDDPAPSWTETDTDTGDYDLGTGATTGPWVQLTGLLVTVPQDVNPGDRLDLTITLYVDNKTTNRNGTIDIGWGIDAAQPAVDAFLNSAIGADYAGLVSINITTTDATLTALQTISVWARRSSGDHSQFGVDLLGSVGTHEMVLSKQ